MHDAPLQEQIEYYRARAPEYDQWFDRRGRYDRGPEANARWRAELAEVEAALDAFDPRGRVLELAGGTGVWTGRLARAADDLTVVDASPEVLAINRARVGDAPVRYVEADLFAWRPDRRYDAAFFGFWLSHVPSERFEPFWRMLAEALRPGGRAFFVDNLAASASFPDEPAGPEQIVRELDDGRRFRIFKLYYQPAELAARLGRLGWRADVRATERYFLYGQASRAP
jgi:demethylmenaquinone methyltransferase/2-methoxy-6-polyprenyl-1,4-benzoquinol methylase